ncbi:MAG: SRPBCC domain-containing protein [Myxococcota bacterium]
MSRTRTTPFALSLLCGLVACSSVHTERVIAAPPEVVWQVITDPAGYGAWNPVIYKVEGEFEEGAELLNHLREPDGREYTITSSVREMRPAEELYQVGGPFWILEFHNRYQLEPVAGGTKVIQHEDYRGIAVPFWNHDWIEPAYARMLEGLEQRVSELSGGGSQ